MARKGQKQMKYAGTLRVRNKELLQKIHIRAAQENTNAIDFTERVMREYLKTKLKVKPII